MEKLKDELLEKHLQELSRISHSAQQIINAVKDGSMSPEQANAANRELEKQARTCREFIKRTKQIAGGRNATSQE